MKKLHLIDDAFLRLESKRQPLHIGMLLLFEPPEGAPEDFTASIAQKLRSSESTVDLFNQRLVEKRGVHYWEENDDFDLDHHFVHLALPKPGRIRELLEMVSRLHGGHMDRTYPLWRVHLIEGLEDGRLAVYMKIHHSMIDGMGGMQMLVNSMSTSQKESKNLPPFWEIHRPPKKGGQIPVIPTPAASGMFAMRALTREGWRSAMPVINKLRKAFKDFRSKNPDVSMAGEAPKCTFNQSISGTRRFAAQSYSGESIRNVARAFAASRNDVVLAMCAGALRKYLLLHSELPSMSLNAGVPVSVRGRAGDSDAANEVAFAITNLATNVADPSERLRAIKSGMDYNKAQLEGLSAGQMQAYAALSLIPGALNMLLGRKPENTVGNLCISHVPGPQKTQYWQGAKLTGMYPISLVTEMGALNITVISRRDNVDFGIIACRKSVPQVQRLLDYLQDALCELEAAAPAPEATVQAVAAKKAPKAKAAAKKAAAKKAPVKKAAAKNRRLKKSQRT